MDSPQNTTTSPQVEQVQPQANSLIKAGFIIRGGAYILDSLLIGVPLYILLLVFFDMKEELSEGVGGLMVLTYFVLATGFYGTTLGKRFFKLKVIKKDGIKVGIGKAIIREVFGKFISSIIFSLGYFWVIWDKEKQGWHDKIAGTYVVQTNTIGKGRKFFAYVLIFFPIILAILGIIVATVLVSINPWEQIRKAEKTKQMQNEFNGQQQLRQNLQENLDTESI